MLGNRGVFKLSKSFFRESIATVTTWNVLASSFNVAPLKKYNFWSQNVGLFEVSDLSVPEGFIKLKVLSRYLFRVSCDLMYPALMNK